MNGRERFLNIMGYQPYDRLPVWYFGTWGETQKRWLGEGLAGVESIDRETGMDPDWERGMWGCHGLVKMRPLYERAENVVLDDTPDFQVVRTPSGSVLKLNKRGECIPQHLAEALKPTREAWREFKKCLDPRDPRRRPPGWEALAARLDEREHATAFEAGSLFGWPREWLGIEQVSYLSYDDPVLYEEIIETVVDFFIEIYRPVLERTHFEFAYFFEDCCGRSGPLFSPDTYRKYYHKHYRRLIEFYRSMGVPYILVDSDGWTDPLIPCWMESGFDIFFPIEVGTWHASPVALRKKFGRNFRMLGGVNKHVIPLGEKAIRAELEPLMPVVREGGFIPIPDHRIPPNCSLDQFRTYVRVFKEVFGS